ncbi:MAG: DUF3090 family protein [Dehalococcoidia bacterium]|nr:DUF3090 family protein [Dehalococcoidia bacterium]MCA9824310.1 DUF3090 family protein [Dehalococcoidia bacterium]MCA9843491.1 DUF3090 family protein [Dehalococcoidia bacterium]MCA9855010.1 DUF3090 family protein [Dehalococcoidia bacterium]
MADVRELGDLIHISAEAIGQPGQRTFRLRALNASAETAFLWMEKEQLAALGEAVQNALKDQSYTYAPRPHDDRSETPVFPLHADVEFRVGQMSMGLDPEDRKIVITGAEAGDPEDSGGQGVTMSFDFRSGHELSEQIRVVVASGRQPCPLCGAPLDPTGHICVKANGHKPVG